MLYPLFSSSCHFLCVCFSCDPTYSPYFLCVYFCVYMCVYQCLCSGSSGENSSHIGRKRQELPNMLGFLITKANPMGGDGALTWQVGLCLLHTLSSFYLSMGLGFPNIE